MYEKYKNNPRFVFISIVSVNNEQKTINGIKKQFKIKYPVFSLPDDECYRLNLHNGYPTNIILDSLGKIHYLKCGGIAKPDKAKEFVEQELEPIIDNLLKK